MSAVVLGDSVLWGQGLRHENKFVTRIAQSVFDLQLSTDDILAHSGAKIGDLRDRNFRLNTPEGNPLDGEVPLSPPSIFSQVNTFQDLRPDVDRELVEVVFLNGGINDIGSQKIVSGNLGSFAVIETKIKNLFQLQFQRLLRRTRGQFPNALIMVFGYHFVFSHLSLRNFAGEIADLENLVDGLPMAKAREFRQSYNRAARQGSWFMALSQSEHQKAIDTFNRSEMTSGKPGCLYVPTLHGPEHASFAPSSLSWDAGITSENGVNFQSVEFGDGGGIFAMVFHIPVRSNDEVFHERKISCEIVPENSDRVECQLAGLFHPDNNSSRRVTDNAIQVHSDYSEPQSIRSLLKGRGNSLREYARPLGYRGSVTYRQLFTTPLISSVRLSGVVEPGSSGDFPYHLMSLVLTKFSSETVSLNLNAPIPFSDDLFDDGLNLDLFPGAQGPKLQVGGFFTFQDVDRRTSFRFFCFITEPLSIHDVKAIEVNCKDVDGGLFNVTFDDLQLEINGRDWELEKTTFNMLDGGAQLLFFR